MIDISEYMQRLKWLSEWMDIQIDYQHRFRRMFRLWNDYGVSVTTTISKYDRMTFEEFCVDKKLNISASNK